MLFIEEITMTEHALKILFVGDENVGKSSFVHRYISGEFNKTYKTTLGVDFSVKLLHWSDKEKIKLQLWDIAGQERFISMTRVYYKGALGCIVMFDVTSSSSFQNCHYWKQDLDSKAKLPSGDSIPCILLANKCDLAEQVVSKDSIDKFCRANGFITWLETSVKDNKNVGEAMRRLVQEILSIKSSLDLQHPRLEDSVSSQQDPSLNRTTGTSCC